MPTFKSDISATMLSNAPSESREKPFQTVRPTEDNHHGNDWSSLWQGPGCPAQSGTSEHLADRQTNEVMLELGFEG